MGKETRDPRYSHQCTRLFGGLAHFVHNIELAMVSKTREEGVSISFLVHNMLNFLNNFLDAQFSIVGGERHFPCWFLPIGCDTSYVWERES